MVLFCQFYVRARAKSNPAAQILAGNVLRHVSTWKPSPARGEKRWLDGLYLAVPEDWDDPYRFFRW